MTTDTQADRSADHSSLMAAFTLEGETDAADGLGRDDNPYDPDRDAGRAWLAGWDRVMANRRWSGVA